MHNAIITTSDAQPTARNAPYTRAPPHPTRSPSRLSSLSQLSDGHVSFPAEAFPPGKRVTGRILSVDAATSHIDLSLRPSAVSPRPVQSFADFSVGQKVKGDVRNVKPFGVFVRLRRSQVDGLAHISECSEERVEDLGLHYKVGDRVRAVVLRKDEEKKTISLGLKARYFLDETDEEKRAAELDSGDDHEDSTVVVPTATAASAQTTTRKRRAEVQEAADGQTTTQAPATTSTATASRRKGKRKAMEETDGVAKAALSKGKAIATSPDDAFDSAVPLQIDLASATPAESTVTASPDADSSAASSQPAGPLTRRAKAAMKRAAEEALETRELALSDPAHVPTAPADFERLLLTSPNSSFLWTRYMALHIGQKAVDDARAVARRALDTIAAREETERLNVWTALVGLELQAQAGSGGEAEAARVVREAMERCDREALLTELTRLYAASGRVPLCIDAHRALTKAFPESQTHWLSFARFLFGQGQLDEARALLQSGLQRQRSVKDEVALVEHFALLEFAHGSVERGRTLLERLLQDHRRRADVWVVWVDAELKLLRGDRAAEGGLAAVRHVLDRAIEVRWSSKKMKHLLQRYMEVEKEYGDERRVEYVKQKAREYVEQRSGGAPQ